MKASRLALTVALLACWALPAGAADLTKIDRTIAKEPAYKNKPKYCLLLFGPEAKARCWLVVDGDVLYVDRKCDGDLTQPNARVTKHYSEFKAVDITEPDGKTRHTRLLLEPCGINDDEWAIEIKLRGKCEAVAGREPNSRLRFADSPGKAPVVHFDFSGPLVIRLYDALPVLRQGQRFQLRACIGTPGLGNGSFAMMCCCNLPEASYPEAEIEYPGVAKVQKIKITGD